MTMEERLYDAAVAGNIRILNQLLQEDPHCLDKATLKCSDKTPLHVAAVLGQVDFAKAITDLSSAMCLARDRDGRNPLHLAAIKGKGDVLKVLIRARPLAVREKTDGGGTILHLCVKYNQPESLKIVLEIIKDSEFLNAKSDESMTILHLAVLDQQTETVRFLVNNNIDVNEKDANGKTALDLLDGNMSIAIAKILQDSRALRAKEMSDDESLEKRRDAIMIVATLIATFAFQAGLSPAGGVWQADSPPDQSGDGSPGPPPHRAGAAIMNYVNPGLYKTFVRVNSVAFVSSVSTILLLISGLPFKHRFFTWFLMVIMWLTIIAAAVSYVISIKTVSSTDARSTRLGTGIITAIVVWSSVMSLLLLRNTIRLIKKWINSGRFKKFYPRTGNPAFHDHESGTQLSLRID